MGLPKKPQMIVENSFLGADIPGSETGNLVLTGFRFHPAELSRLERLAKEMRTSRASLVRLAVLEFLERRERKDIS